MLTVIEKVLFLKDIDFFRNTATDDLAHVASITEEVRYEADSEVFKQGSVSDAMYLVVQGRVRLIHGNQEVQIAEPKNVFGMWALFDDEPRIVTAQTIEACIFLKLERDDFFELLSDHPKITQALLKTISKRLRDWIDRFQY